MAHPPWSVGALLELSGSYWKTCTLHAGVCLKVFTVIGKNCLTAQEIAKAIHADHRAMSMLLNALTALGLLIHTDQSYQNTPEAYQFLSEDSPDYIGFMIMHHHHLVESWAQLHMAVQSGKPVRTRSSFNDPERRKHFLMGMFNNAKQIAPKLVPQIDLSGCKRLLDLGGGPGTYAIFFCKHYSELTATVFDLPTTQPFAEKTIAQFGMSDRIRFLAGDYTEDAITGTYDVAWLSHILHAESPETCLKIIKKTASVLEPKGKIFIHEFILNDSMDSPLFPALFSLNMLLGTEQGQSYSEKQLKDMLEAAGFIQIQRHPFKGPTDSGVIYGLMK